ncbi:hypothetical protein PHO31112_05437 [Pandoraea horticolens]|uniref:Uncharacterized protein n=1 Tax=Pandoraea horticolens TaxID=2508298 RepID=A0A5E4ZCX4_9BURK|nr:hypothetical protein PHO31112_05437 [Pandoraea horticolens]
MTLRATGISIALSLVSAVTFTEPFALPAATCADQYQSMRSSMFIVVHGGTVITLPLGT